MAGVAQLVRAPDCDSGGHRFETGHSPHLNFYIHRTNIKRACVGFFFTKIILLIYYGSNTVD